jgi:hypothetical protein
MANSEMLNSEFANFWRRTATARGPMKMVG